MAVAKSYENCEIIGEPYVSSTDKSKKYVKVKAPCPRCGGSGHYSFNLRDGTMCLQCRGAGSFIKEVRWYTDSQRASMDKAAEKRNANKAKAVEERKRDFSARKAFGFGDEGFITIFRGNKDIINEWAHTGELHKARYSTFFGWYVVAEKPVEDLLEGMEAVRLNWSDVCVNEYDMKSNDKVKAIVDKLLFVPSKSKFQGEKNQWILKEVVIKKNKPVESQFGSSNMHIMEDKDENVYVWFTSSKSLEEGKTYTINMKVKEHKEYEGVQQTIVYYCKVK